MKKPACGKPIMLGELIHSKASLVFMRHAYRPPIQKCICINNCALLGKSILDRCDSLVSWVECRELDKVPVSALVPH